MSRLASHSLIYLASNVATVALPFLLLPVLTRYLSPLQYGQVATFQALMTVVTLLIGMNLPSAVSVEKFKGVGERLPQFLSSCILISAGATAILCAIILPVRGEVAGAVGIPAVWLFGLAAGGFAASIQAYRLIIWQIHSKPIPYGFFSVGLALFNLGLSLVFVIGLDAGADGRVAGLLLSSFLLAAVAIVLMVRDGSVTLAWDPASARKALLFSVPLIPHSLAGIAMSQADRFLIGQELGLGEAGVYAAAMQMTMPIVMVAMSFNRAYVPWLYERLSSGQQSAAVTISAAGAIVSVFGTFILVGLAMMIVPIFLGENFAHAGQLLPWLAPAVAAQATYYMFVNFIFYSERNAWIPAITVVVAVSYVTAGFFAVSGFGARGLAIAYSASSIAQTIAIFILAQKVYPLAWFDRSTYLEGFAMLRTRGATISDDRMP